MDRVTAGAIALATLLLNKSVEKTGEILAEKAFERGICWLNARDSSLAAEIIQELFNCAKSEINAAKKQLYKRHLIGQVEERDGAYKIHPLIREFLQAKLAALEQANEFRQAFAATFVEIAKKIPESPSSKDIESVKDAIPHLEEVAQNLTDALRDEDFVWPFVGLGRFYKGRLYARAEPWYRHCLELSQRLLGDDHPDVATSLNNLAALYNSQGRYAEAEPLYHQALELNQRLLGDDHPQVAISLNNLGFVHYEQGRYREAELLYHQALELRKRLLGKDHPDVAQSLNNLAGLYESQGRYTEAEPLYLQALTLTERVLGVNHPNTITVSENLALFRQHRSTHNSSLRKGGLLPPFNLVERFTQFLKRAAKNLD
jgi:tetratricopeptide (TPR) repeat protein